MQSTDFEVAIIGAGAAGLCAATELARGGCSVVLLEARDRFGGRIYTHGDSAVPYPIELGAEFIHGDAPVTKELLQAAGVVAIDAVGERFTRRGQEIARGYDSFREVQRLLQGAEALPQDQSVTQYLQRCSGTFERGTIETVRMMVEGFDAADPQEASIKAIAKEWSGSSLEGQARPLGGYAPLIHHLVRCLDRPNVRVMLSTCVEAVEWGGSAVRLSGRQAGAPIVLTAHKTIVTIPVSLLKGVSAGGQHLRFDPELHAKHEALQGLALGHVVKVVLQFRRPFWEELHQQQLKDAGFMHVPGASFPTLWTLLALRLPLLTAWSGGPEAQKLSSKDREEVIREALCSVGRFLGLNEASVRDEITAVHHHDWSADPWSRGAYCYLTVGGEKAPELLAQPLQQRLYFAGDATHGEQTGTVEAALASGRRAAQSVLQSMRSTSR